MIVRLSRLKFASERKMDLSTIDILRWVLIFLWVVFLWENYLSFRQVSAESMYLVPVQLIPCVPIIALCSCLVMLNNAVQYACINYHVTLA